MNVIQTAIPDVLILEPKVFGDDRGFFFESYNQRIFEDAVGRKVEFVQDNHSKSAKGVLRGLHYQLAPHAQAKLVRCLQGAIYDVAVDIRLGSPTFGQWVGAELSAENKHQIWIPEGFAHGFIALEHDTEILYKTNDFYSKECERSIKWDDEQLNIAWPEKAGIISEKDAMAPAFSNADLFKK
ncbi:dTDP-4-dehydrorhamnose 3,5-epimerase [Cronobacter turicensis]|uniref:dTDP-4-dehydrorhamnose 3,5-epimerase n=1 Tax=Cronobacter turicensis TaxID=413502 RepID=UPI000CFCF42B|nr:dTDP-4-dehydrorhamnose 3,5-epimerase [Cronobacter turicensis]EKM0365131.1 dTDP-4-dehydrorhamnose 3,5-epimerase [Cronobacter turicensis]EKM0371059.1 dTDP-4-dehydrorhamnose 3,5-epimerase [Cronobacter turicensis]EKM0533445.1 dTDP-4-dehydrorhamnose 3,5-epimerase [Cronobacter turicensis]EKM5761758.1 dTDP-4-dehydrorhamnose 3,5-epimerase [Cronobacter turicensis]ELQ6108850.1 dTDP-4-dehydrorhamnose 3,5-epimerase [Cronobacter turicensis]